MSGREAGEAFLRVAQMAKCRRRRQTRGSSMPRDIYWMHAQQKQHKPIACVTTLA
jgi:hypothetical protein